MCLVILEHSSKVQYPHPFFKTYSYLYVLSEFVFLASVDVLNVFSNFQKLFRVEKVKFHLTN